MGPARWARRARGRARRRPRASSACCGAGATWQPCSRARVLFSDAQAVVPGLLGTVSGRELTSPAAPAATPAASARSSRSPARSTPTAAPRGGAPSPAACRRHLRHHHRRRRRRRQTARPRMCCTVDRRTAACRRRRGATRPRRGRGRRRGRGQASGSGWASRPGGAGHGDVGARGGRSPVRRRVARRNVARSESVCAASAGSRTHRSASTSILTAVAHLYHRICRPWLLPRPVPPVIRGDLQQPPCRNTII